MDELIATFSLERVSKSGARFNPEKARWFNAQYLKQKSDAELAALFRPVLNEKGIEASDRKVEQVMGLMKERATFVSELWELTSFLFVAPDDYDPKATAKFWKGDNPARIRGLRDLLATVTDFGKENTEKSVMEWIAANEYPTGQVMNAFRLAIIGKSTGPSMFEVCEILGRDETLRRLDAILTKLGTGENA